MIGCVCGTQTPMNLGIASTLGSILAQGHCKGVCNDNILQLSLRGKRKDVGKFVVVMNGKEVG